MLIATLPAVYQEELLDAIIGHPLVDQLRYNTGKASPYTAKETIQRLVEKTQRAEKTLWVDLKARQLRISQWSYPKYGGRVRLNHELSVDLPASIVFRGGDRAEIKAIKGSTVFIDPPPKHAVGEGQAVNVLGDDLMIKGFLTDQDKEYVEAAIDCGVGHFMLSYTESQWDCDRLWSFIKSVKASAQQHDFHFAWKIESPRGSHFARHDWVPGQGCLMAARDDLFLEMNGRAKTLGILKAFAERDSQAICASRLFKGLETEGKVSLSDFSDLALMQIWGYQRFLLSDGVCEFHFSEAMEAWANYLEHSKSWLA